MSAPSKTKAWSQFDLAMRVLAPLKAVYVWSPNVHSVWLYWVVDAKYLDHERTLQLLAELEGYAAQENPRASYVFTVRPYVRGTAPSVPGNAVEVWRRPGA